MTLGPEAKLEQKCVKHAQRYGWRGRKFAFISCRGANDRLFGKGGAAKLVEFKKFGENATLQQVVRQKELREVYGFEVHTVDSFPYFCAVLGIPRT